MKQYSMYIDDIRNPKLPAPIGDWIICRNMREVMSTIEANGLPTNISFDHDLGEEELDGYSIAKFMCKKFQEQGIPEDFTFNVHSANPVGAENIECFMSNCIKYLR